MKRDHYFSKGLGGDSQDPASEDTEDRVVVGPDEDYNLIGSTCGLPMGWHGGKYRNQKEDITHMPVLDIDHKCYLYESETPGHFHLYIDVPMSWEKYEAIINALEEAGVVEHGYARLSRERKATFVAPKPWKGSTDG